MPKIINKHWPSTDENVKASNFHTLLTGTLITENHSYTSSVFIQILDSCQSLLFTDYASE